MDGLVDDMARQSMSELGIAPDNLKRSYENMNGKLHVKWENPVYTVLEEKCASILMSYDWLCEVVGGPAIIDLIQANVIESLRNGETILNINSPERKRLSVLSGVLEHQTSNLSYQRHPSWMKACRECSSRFGLTCGNNQIAPHWLRFNTNPVTWVKPHQLYAHYNALNVLHTSSSFGLTNQAVFDAPGWLEDINDSHDSDDESEDDSSYYDHILPNYNYPSDEDHAERGRMFQTSMEDYFSHNTTDTVLISRAQVLERVRLREIASSGPRDIMFVDPRSMQDLDENNFSSNDEAQHDPQSSPSTTRNSDSIHSSTEIINQDGSVAEGVYTLSQISLHRNDPINTRRFASHDSKEPETEGPMMTPSQGDWALVPAPSGDHGNTRYIVQTMNRSDSAQAAIQSGGLADGNPSPSVAVATMNVISVSEGLTSRASVSNRERITGFFDIENRARQRTHDPSSSESLTVSNDQGRIQGHEAPWRQVYGVQTDNMPVIWRGVDLNVRSTENGSGNHAEAQQLTRRTVTPVRSHYTMQEINMHSVSESMSEEESSSYGDDLPIGSSYIDGNGFLRYVRTRVIPDYWPRVDKCCHFFSCEGCCFEDEFANTREERIEDLINEGIAEAETLSLSPAIFPAYIDDLVILIGTDNDAALYLSRLADVLLRREVRSISVCCHYCIYT